MSLIEQTKLLLRKHRSLPKRSYGQNFLVEQAMYELMLKYASLNQHDTVLDIGAGLGFLTSLASSKCREVLAVEADPHIAGILREQLANKHNVRIIEGDIFRVKLPSFNKIVSTPPYNISTRLALWILNQSIERAILVFQKEFANRLVAHVGSEDYGWLTVLTYYLAEAELLDDVLKSSFFPQPKIGSVIIRLIPKVERGELGGKSSFKRLVQSLFSQRNRKLKSAILPYLSAACGLGKIDAAKVAATLSLKDRRVRELTPDDFGALADDLEI